MGRRPGSCAVARCRGTGEYEVVALSQALALVCRPCGERLGRISGNHVVVDQEKIDGWVMRVPDDSDASPVLWPPGTAPPFLGE